MSRWVWSSIWRRFKENLYGTRRRGRKACMQLTGSSYGLKDLEIMNDALLGRIGWNLLSKPESIWSQVLIGKYGRNKNLLEECVAKSTDSDVWRNVAGIGEVGRM
ncbi:hypothetical protein K1719_013070 [Acacia pycnantha]|nr:hypothetical protein K1719_013070 [Acacia pycnantha]